MIQKKTLNKIIIILSSNIGHFFLVECWLCCCGWRIAVAACFNSRLFHTFCVVESRNNFIEKCTPPKCRIFHNPGMHAVYTPLIPISHIVLLLFFALTAVHISGATRSWMWEYICSYCMKRRFSCTFLAYSRVNIMQCFGK